MSGQIGVRIMGTGMAVPERVVSNDDLAKFVDTSDEWIRPRTGIVTRRLAQDVGHNPEGTDSGIDTSDLAAEAVTHALKNADLASTDLDLLIVATMTPDMICPATACQVVDKIGAVPCGAMDINMACTGFVGALGMASNAIASGFYKHVAIVGAERMSKVVNWQDRRTCILFADGAGAAVLGPSDDPKDGCEYQKLWSDASKADALYMPRTPRHLPENIDPTVTDAAGWNGKYNTLQMDGSTVYKFAVKALQNCVNAALEHAGLDQSDIAMVIPHQSNIRMLQTAWKRLGFPDDKIYINIDRFGNTSAASIGLCLHELNEQGKLKKGDRIIFVAQGGGLTWGVNLWRF